MVFPPTSLVVTLADVPFFEKPGISGKTIAGRESLLAMITEIVKGRSIGKTDWLNSIVTTLSTLCAILNEKLK
ncbi:hypothetical protein GCM10027341_30060 [Spirosoma knui]